MVRAWQDALYRCVEQAIEMGHLLPDTDPYQLVYEMYGLILALHHDARFIKRPGSVDRAQAGFERLLKTYVSPTSPANDKPAAANQNSKSAAKRAA
jgi:hypothetical protein